MKRNRGEARREKAKERLWADLTEGPCAHLNRPATGNRNMTAACGFQFSADKLRNISH